MSSADRNQGVSRSFGLLTESSVEPRGAIEQPHQASEFFGRLGHCWISFVRFDGGVYPGCVCGFLGTCALTEDLAWLQACDVELGKPDAWQESDDRLARITAAGSFGGVRR